MSVRITLLPRKSIRERAWKTLSLVVAITTILNVSMVGALVAPKTAKAAEETTTAPTPLPNPELGRSCGLDVALVIDSSSSIDATELGKVKTAFNGFVDAVLPGTPTQLSVTEFNQVANVRQSLTDNTAALHTAINGATTSVGTNWQDALVKAWSTINPGSTKPNLVIFASDGNPNHIGNPSPNTVPAYPDITEAVNAAIVQANIIKAAGTRIVTLGIGNELNTANLEKISSADAVYTTSFDTLVTTLANLAKELCGGKILVQKQFQVGNAFVKTGSLVSGFDFTLTGGTSPVTKTTDTSGLVEYDVLNGTYSVTEASKAGAKLLGATCGQVETEKVDLETRTISGVIGDAEGTVTCTFTNEPTGNVSGTKFHDWNGNGMQNEGEEGLQGITIKLDGTTQTVTDSNGHYAFTKVTHESHTISEVVPEGWFNTTPASVTTTVTDETVVNFGNREYAHVRVLKNVDENGDGDVTDASDVIGATNWTWDLNSGNQNYATGSSFQNVIPGVTIVSEDQKAGYQVIGSVCSPIEVEQGPRFDATAVVAPSTTKTIETVEGGFYQCTFTNSKIITTPNLSITKSNNVVGFTNPGKQVTYTITVSNLAPATGDALAVVMDDTLPAGFTFADTGLATKSIAVGDLAVGASKSFSFLVNISSTQTAGIYTNTAKAKGTNTSEVKATSNVEVRIPSVLGVTSEPTMLLTKTVNVTTVTAGGTATYTVMISNPGDVDLTNVVLTDTLPKGFTFSDTGKAIRTWSIGTLKAHHQRVINYTVNVDAATKAGQYENKAVVTSAELDPQTAKVAVTVKAPRVLGLATTGAGLKDYLVFAFGLSIFLFGAAWVLSMSHRPRHDQFSA